METRFHAHRNRNAARGMAAALAVLAAGCGLLEPAAKDPAVPPSEQFLTRSEPETLIAPADATASSTGQAAPTVADIDHWQRQVDEWSRRAGELQTRLLAAEQHRNEAEVRCRDLEARLLSAAIDKARVEQELLLMRVEVAERDSARPPAGPPERK